MWEEATKITLLGMDVYAFGFFCALGAALALLVLSMQMKKERMEKGAAALTGCLAMLFSFVVSRLFYALLDRSLGGMMPVKGALMITAGGYSMVGALLGGVLGAALSGKILKGSALKMADMIAPALLLFVACERLGEGYVPDFGISRPLLGDALKGSFLAVEGEYDWYLATYLLESFAALVIALILLRDLGGKKRAGDTLLLGLILYGAAQSVLESLRYDRHLSFSFVGSQHIAAIAFLGVAVIILAARNWKNRRGLALAGIISIPLVVGLGITLEFMIDRTEINRYVLYLAYVILVSVPAYLGIRLRKEA